MVVVDRDKKTCNIIDIAVPVDAGIVEKEKEKVVPRPRKRGGTTLECQSKRCSYCGWCARRRHTQKQTFWITITVLKINLKRHLFTKQSLNRSVLICAGSI